MTLEDRMTFEEWRAVTYPDIDVMDLTDEEYIALEDEYDGLFIKEEVDYIERMFG